MQRFSLESHCIFLKNRLVFQQVVGRSGECYPTEKRGQQQAQMPGPQLEYQAIDKPWYPTGLMALPARGSQQWEIFCGRNNEGCFEQARHRSAEIPVQLASELGDTAQVSELVCPVHETLQFFGKAPVFQHTRRAPEQEQQLSFSNQPYCR